MMETQVDSNNKLFALLSFLSFSQIEPERLNLNYFDSALIEKVIDGCRLANATSVALSSSSATALASSISSSIDSTNAMLLPGQLYDIKKLRSILVYEIRQSALNISRANLLNELKCILENVLERNLFQLSFLAKRKYFDSLKLLVESFTILMPCEVFPLNQRYTFLVAFIKRLFQNVREVFCFVLLLKSGFCNVDDFFVIVLFSLTMML